MRKLTVFGAFLLIVLPCSAVFAGDLVGEWKAVEGKNYGAVSGAPGHAVRPSGQHFSAAIPWVLKVTSQQNGGFHGEWCSPKGCEPLVGVIRKDGSLLMVDEDSTLHGTMYGDEMEVCVTEPGKSSRVSACNMMKKVTK